MPQNGTVVRARVMHFTVGIVESCPVGSEGNPTAKPFGETIRQNLVPCNVKDLQSRVIGTAVSDGIGEEATILGNRSNSNGSRDSACTQCRVNQDSLFPE